MIDAADRRYDHTADDRRSHWPLAAVAVIATLLGAHLVVYRPMKNQMEIQVSSMQKQMTAMRGEIQELVGARSDAADANNLLTELNNQRDQVHKARLAMGEITSFRRRVQREADLAKKSAARVQDFARMEKSLADSRRLITDVTVTLSELNALQRQLVTAGERLDNAKRSLDGFVALRSRIVNEAKDLEDAECRLIELGYLKSLVLDESKDIRRAKTNLGTLVGIKNSINNNSADLPVTMQNAERLLIMKNEIANAGNVDRAMTNLRWWRKLGNDLTAAREQSTTAAKVADRMISMAGNLSAKSRETEAAEKNLKSLMSMRDQINNGTRQIGSAVKTLEILIDLQAELTKRAASLTGIRKNLLEIVLLESTVARTVRAMRPLTQLGNLRRLSDREIREAARNILDGRRARLGYNSSPAPSRPLNSQPTGNGSKPVDGKSLFQGLVPSPIDLD